MYKLIIVLFFCCIVGCTKPKTEIQSNEEVIGQLQSEKSKLLDEAHNLKIKTKEDFKKNEEAQELCKNIVIVEGYIEFLEGKNARIRKEKNIEEQANRREQYRKPGFPDLEDKLSDMPTISEKASAVMDRLLLQQRYEAERQREEWKANEENKLKEKQKKEAVENLCPEILILKKDIDAIEDTLDPKQEEWIKQQKDIAERWQHLHSDIARLAYNLEDATRKNHEGIVKILQEQWPGQISKLNQLQRDCQELVFNIQHDTFCYHFQDWWATIGILAKMTIIVLAIFVGCCIFNLCKKGSQ